MLGLLAAWLLMRVERDPATGRAYSVAGVGCGALWVIVLARRVGFVYGFQNVFTASLVGFLSDHHLHVVALVDALIYLPLAMLLLRAATLSVRSRNLGGNRVPRRRQSWTHRITGSTSTGRKHP